MSLRLLYLLSIALLCASWGTLTKKIFCSGDPLIDNGYDVSDDDEYDDASDDDDDAPMDENATVVERTNDDVNRTLSSKESWNRALSRSRDVARFARKHRGELTLAFGAFAFRREIAHVLLRRASPSNALKLIVFADLLWRTTRSSSLKAAGEESSRAPALLQWLGLPVGPHGYYGGTYNPPARQHFMFERLNDRHALDQLALRKALGTATHTHRRTRTARSKRANENGGEDDGDVRRSNNTVIVFEVKADAQMTQLSQLRDTVSFLLSVADSLNETTTNTSTTNDDNDDETAASSPTTTTTTPPPLFPRRTTSLEVVVLLESPGGAAPAYGLASAQLRRLRDGVSSLTVCVDKVAASGGYMMACCAEHLCAAPFGVVGSVGVVARVVNLRDALEQRGARSLSFRAPGHGKAPVDALSEITSEGAATVQTMVDRTHAAFREWVREGRACWRCATDDDDDDPLMDEACTGEVWSGRDAVRLGLVDRLITSDEYLRERMRDGDTVLRLHRYERGRLGLFPPSPGLLGLSSSSSSGPRGVWESLRRAVEDVRRILARTEDLLEGRVSTECRDADVDAVIGDRFAVRTMLSSVSGVSVRTKGGGC